jgi:hypothetical protein
LIHASVNGAEYNAARTDDSPYGFVVTGGEQLMGVARTTNNPQSTGLTFVSDQAVYIQGDYNTVNKQPAAVLADSLNVLSSACKNQNGMINKSRSGAGCTPDINNETRQVNGAETTINSAFLAGTDETNGSSYNGGLENYPRFSENWNQALNYRGSFVSLGKARRVSGTWSSQRYGAPVRNWEYDTGFNDVDNLPPLSPRFVHIRQAAFERYLD